MQLGFSIDLRKCLGCHACEAACAAENQLGGGLSFRRVSTVEYLEGGSLEITYLSIACNHCANPECFRVCPNGTYRKRRDGVVLHDARTCSGCGKCVRVCPYKAPVFDPGTGRVDKCQLCADRLSAGRPPACVEACPVAALRLIDLDTAHLDGAVKRTVGFPDTRLTKPSARFYPRPARVVTLGQQCARGGD
jgi:anaerobic dimethyl sulfoxide reductase subunit B (iron-sulfur subunit)